MTAVLEKTYPVEIVPVELLTHPNADLLSIIPVFGYTYVGRTEDWTGVTKGAYIPPDSIVDATRSEFLFLVDQAKDDGKVRIKAKKLRGVLSFGLMVPVPDETPLGEDWAERLGVEHYEPPLASEKKVGKGKGPFTTDEASAPAVFAPKYDLDAFRRYHKLFEQGEPVVVTEKLDGANARYTCIDGEMHCGSRERWTREFCDVSHITVDYLISQGCEPEKAEHVFNSLTTRPQKRNIWWQALRNYSAIEEFCRANPGSVLYGEIYGDVNCIKYGLGGNVFSAFDILKDGKFLNPFDFYQHAVIHGLPIAPLVNTKIVRVEETGGSGVQVTVPYDFDAICAMAEGPTLVKHAKEGTIREGVVVAPVEERTDPHLGRVKMKVVSGAYLERFR